MDDEFAKHLDDVVRHELLLLRRHYNDIVRAIEPSRGGGGGAVMRLHPPYEDVAIDEPEPGVSSEAFAARVRRRLIVALEAPERPPAPPEND